MTIEVPPTLGLVLAGGLARRMGGGDKALIEIGGVTILDRVLARPDAAMQRRSSSMPTAIRRVSRDSGFRWSPTAFRILPVRLPAFSPGSTGRPSNMPEIALAGERAGRLSVPARRSGERLHEARTGGGGAARLRQSGRLAASGRGAVAASLCAKTCAARWSRRICTRSRSGPRATASRIAEWPDKPVDPFFNVNTPEDRARAEAIAAAKARRLRPLDLARASAV